MTNNNHPITPPPELVASMIMQTFGPLGPTGLANKEELAKAFASFSAMAAKWGADQELDACCDWMSECTVGCTNELRAARRPKPQSLKEEALKALKHAEEGWRPVPADCAIIRRALESLPD